VIRTARQQIARLAATGVSGRRVGAVAALVAIFSTGCLGFGGEGDGGDRRRAAIDAALASVPQYPGARLVDRHDRATEGEFQYEVPVTVQGSQVQLHFRRLLATRRWRCTFNERAPGVPYGFTCRRGEWSLEGEIGDRGGYGLVVQT
jgi:hypothetical protein